MKLFITKSLPNDVSLTLTSDELADAEKLRISHALPHEKNFSAWKYQFNLFLDDKGIGDVVDDSQMLTFHMLPSIRDHSLTTLIVQDAHNRVGHNGVKETLTEIRRKFWIVKCRSLVKSVFHQCVLCRMLEGIPFCAPPPPPLPAFRVKEEPPLDFAGPLFSRSFGLTLETNKAWICLFTCLVTRAVHLAGHYH